MSTERKKKYRFQLKLKTEKNKKYRLSPKRKLVKIRSGQVLIMILKMRSEY